MCTEEYSAEELALLNGTQDVEGDEIGDEEGDESVGCTAVGGEEGNPWAWAEGLDPAEVQKTHTKFTQKTQALSEREKEIQAMRDELAPLNRLRDNLESDEGLVRAIEQYYAGKGEDPESKVKEVEQKLTQLETNLAIDKEMGDVAKYVRECSLPDFDEDELLAYATKHRILNLRAAYRDMNFDRVQNLKADQLTEDIKRGKGAALPKTRRADTGGKTKYSEADIAAMTDDEFQEHFNDIFASYTKPA